MSRIAFGCEQLGGIDWGKYERDRVVQAVHTALDLGVNFFDTADVYALGGSEQLLAESLGNARREVIIATKGGVNWQESDCGGRARTFIDLRPERVTHAIEASLRRLRLETIPLYILHWPDPHTPLQDTLGAMKRAQEQGKVRYIGVSNFPAKQIREAHSIVEISAVQEQYNLINRHAESEIVPCCKELGIGILAYGPLAQGLLTGKYGEADCFGTDDRRSRLPHFQGAAFEANLMLVARMRSIACTGHKKTLPQIALRWLLDKHEVTSVITGAKDSRQIDENVGALGWRLSEADAGQLEMCAETASL